MMKSAIDRFIREIDDRFIRLKELNKKYVFMVDVNYLLNDKILAELKENCKNLGDFSITDLNGPELFKDICDCRMLLISLNATLQTSPLKIWTFIIYYGDEVFLNLSIAPQIIFTIEVSIASRECSFIKFITVEKTGFIFTLNF